MGTYNYNATVQLSKHFNVSEFRCKCGKAHDTLINPTLIQKLEKLYAALDCSKIIVTSGYRCAAHDKAVGGNGSGQHTKGTAADIRCYDKSGKVISTKLVACKAQDIGFLGIGNIDSTYTAIHVDVRPSGKWYGDEAVKGGTACSVTSDYYKYYGIPRETAAHAWTYKHDAQIQSLQEVLIAKGNKLTPDGIAGEKTLAACKQYTIQLGDRGDLVRWVQLRLGIVADGIAGGKTMAAIAQFQRKNGLGEGYLGGEDWYFLIK